MLVEVAPGVHVATSEVYTTTSTVVVGDDGACLVVDPAVTARDVAELGAALRARGWRAVAVWSTHAHWDHVLDGAGLSGVPRWATWSGEGIDDVTVARLAAQRDADDELARALRDRPDDRPAPIAPLPRPAALRPETPGAAPTGAWRVLDHEATGWPGPRTLVLSHRAHAPGHSALLLPETGVLVAGDMLSDLEIPLLDDHAADPVGDHLAALDAFASCGAGIVVPGHGTVGADLAERVAADRGYLSALARGEDTDDARLAAPAQRAAHEQQRELVLRRPGRPTAPR